MSYDGRRVQIDVSSLGNRTQGTVVFQLLNQDGDSGSVVKVQHLLNTVDPAGTSSPILRTPVARAAIASALSVDTFRTTLDAKLIVSNVQLDRVSGRYMADVQVRNTGATTLSRQMVVLLTNLPQVGLIRCHKMKKSINVMTQPSQPFGERGMTRMAQKINHNRANN